MSVAFNKTTIVALTIFALTMLTSGASAAPSLGFPSGRPYYGSSNQQFGSRSGTMRSYAPARSDETRQSFSYEPAESEPTTVTHGSSGCGGHHHSHSAMSGDSGKAVAKTPQVERRSFAYEPSVQPEPRARSYNRSVAPK
jgi:hypothetical protein